MSGPAGRRKLGAAPVDAWSLQCVWGSHGLPDRLERAFVHHHDHSRREPTISRRAFLRGAAAAPLAAYLAACTGGSPPGRTRAPQTTATALSPAPGPSTLSPELRRIAGLVPRDVLERVYNGYFPGMSGDIVTIPLGFNYFDGGISHSTAWPYTANIPMVWYGPGIIPARGLVGRRVTSADQAPTLARLAGYPDFDAPDGQAMEEIFDPKAPKPKLVVTLVWDAGGTYVLGLWPKYWPNLQRLMHEGVAYTHADVGSAPSSTAPVHATMGTGAFPRRHGILDNVIRFRDGQIGDPWTPGPKTMLLPGFADLYKTDLGDRVQVGTFGTLNWHLGMMGKGKQFDPRNDQVVVLRERGGDEGAEGISWGLSEVQAESYRFPEYVNDLPDISTYFHVADDFDGTKDGKWRGHDIVSLKGGFDTPARLPYMERAIEEVMTREGFGHHDGTDLFFINFKLIDEVGHLFNASSLEEGDCVKAQDELLPPFIDFLDRRVGRGNWVLLITADHGHSAGTDVSGAYPIKVQVLEPLMAERFPTKDHSPVVARIRPGWSFVDGAEMVNNGYDLEQLSKSFQTLTKSDAGKDPTKLEPAARDDEVLLAALPGSVLPALLGKTS